MEFLRELKIIWKYLEGYKKEVIKFSLFSLVGSVFLAVIPYTYILEKNAAGASAIIAGLFLCYTNCIRENY